MDKKIGLMIPHLESGGSERVLTTISKVLTDLGYDVYFFVFEKGNISYDVYGTLIDLNCPAKKGMLIRVINALNRIIKTAYYKRKLKLDVVISFLLAANRVNILSFSPAKVVISSRGFSNYKSNIDFYIKHINKIEKIVFPVMRMEQDFTSRYPAGKEKSYVLGNPFDTNRISDLAQEDASDEFTDFIDGKKALITVGSFKRDKGFWNLIKSFEIINENCADARLVIIGHRGEMEDEIINMVKSSHYSDNILMLGYQANPFKYLSKADVFLCTSLNEGFPNCIVEAMCCGTAIVSTDCTTGPREILSYENDIDNYALADYGVLTKTFDETIDFDLNNKNEYHRNFANAVLELLSDNKLMKEYKSKALTRANTYSMEEFTKQLDKFILSL